MTSVPNLNEVLDVDTLRAAHTFGISACDARFLAAAQTLGTKLVTEDSRLRKAAPELTQSLAQALAG